MALKALLDSLDGLPEAVAAEYSEVKIGDDTKYRLDVTPVGDLALGEIGKVQKALQTERKTRDELKKQLDAYKGDDGELVPAENALNAIKTLDELGDEASVDAKVKAGLKAKEQQLADKYAAQERQLLDKHQGEVKTLNENLTVTTKQLERALIDQQATMAIAENNGSPELLLPIIRSTTRMVRGDDGEHRVEVIGSDGNSRLSQKPGSGTEHMTISEYVELLREDDKFGRAFESSGASGSGATQSDSRGSNSNGKPYLLSKADSKDPHKYRAAKEAADKAGRELQIGA